MNGKERFIATINGDRKDQIPFIPTISLLSSKLIGNSLIKHYTDPKAYAQAQITATKELGIDCVISPLFFAGIGEAYGGTLKYYDNQAPNLKIYPASTPEEYLKLKYPDINSNPSLLYIRNIVKNLKKYSQDETMVCAIVLNPVDLPIVTIGIDNWIETILFNNSKLDQVFEKNINDFVKWGNTLLEDGADFLFVSGGFLSSDIVPRYLVKDTLLPIVDKAFAQIKGPIVLHNSGSSILHCMDLYSKLPNVIGLYTHITDNLQLAYQSINQNQFIVGGLDGLRINRLSSEQTYIQTLKYLNGVVNIDKFIMGTSAADINYDTPIENIKAISRAIVDFSKGIRYE